MRDKPGLIVTGKNPGDAPDAEPPINQSIQWLRWYMAVNPGVSLSDATREMWRRKGIVWQLL